jgi:teichuronic acid biosynthesis glycosyltransferase TuaH
MNVDWDWAKQRPHFIAEHLSDSHDVIILYPYSWRRSQLNANPKSHLRVFPFFRIPLGGKSSFVRGFNLFVLKIMAKILFSWRLPDIIWICSPEFFRILPKNFSATLIYDCMDDFLAFPANTKRKEELAVCENALISASSLVFCPTENLKSKLISRSQNAEKFHIIHNACEPTAFYQSSEDIRVNRLDNFFVLGYIGTVSSWFDFDALISLVDAIQSIEIHIVGPIENLTYSLPQHERIKYLGSVKHIDIKTYVNKFDALIMPFKVTDLIQSVDPVKLYEYIYFNKPIISVWYQELERFSKFVDFYNNKDQLIEIVNKYLGNSAKRKYSAASREIFIKENTWASRIELIEERFGLLSS